MKLFFLNLFFVSLAAMNQRIVKLTILADGEKHGKFVSSKLYIDSKIKALFTGQEELLQLTAPQKFYIELAWHSAHQNHTNEIWCLKTKDTNEIPQEKYCLPISELLEESSQMLCLCKRNTRASLYNCPIRVSEILSPTLQSLIFIRNKENVATKYQQIKIPKQTSSVRCQSNALSLPPLLTIVHAMKQKLVLEDLNHPQVINPFKPIGTLSKAATSRSDDTKQ